MQDTILDVKNLNTSFVSDKQAVRIIKDVSLKVKRGTTLAVVGESGCGKSITVNSIIRLLPKNAILSCDHIIYRSSKSDTEYRIDQMSNFGPEIRALRGPEISMIFQDPMAALNPVQKIGNQIIEGYLHHNPKVKKKDALSKAVSLLEQLGIPSAKQRIQEYPHQMSGGMKQRVVIATAMICDPDIIIADEPTTALDVTIQAQIMELMKKLQTERNKTIILITHNMGLVAEMADEVLVMYMGRIVECGKIEEIFEEPSHPYTIALLKSVPVLGMDEAEKLVSISGSTPNPAELKDGCEFADRCQFCMASCRNGIIKNYRLSDTHTVRCLRYQNFEEVD